MAGAEELLPAHEAPPEVRLCGKLEVLDRILPKLHATRHKVRLRDTGLLRVLIQDLWNRAWGMTLKPSKPKQREWTRKSERRCHLAEIAGRLGPRPCVVLCNVAG